MDYKIGDVVIYKSEQDLVDGVMTYFPEPWEGTIASLEHEDGYILIDCPNGEDDFDLVKREQIISLK